MDKMVYKYIYNTPDNFSNIVMNSDGKYLTGLGFPDGRGIDKRHLDCEEKMLPIFDETIEWLNIYFSGKDPDFTPEYRIDKLTPFRQDVINSMLNIPFGETLTYGEIAKSIAEKYGMKKMSSRAVGGAVGWNPIGIIIPCHRVIGANGALTGYGGGMKNKIALLALEGNDFISKKGHIKCKFKSDI